MRPLRKQPEPIEEEKDAGKEVWRSNIAHERHGPLPEIERTEHDHTYQQQEEERQHGKLEHGSHTKQETRIVYELSWLRGLGEAEHYIHSAKQEPVDKYRFIERIEQRIDGSKQQVNE